MQKPVHDDQKRMNDERKPMHDDQKPVIFSESATLNRTLTPRYSLIFINIFATLLNVD